MTDRLAEIKRTIDVSERDIGWLIAEVERLRQRLLSAAGDDLCRLTQEEINELSEGVVQIPPKEEFLASCERFHTQIASESGVMTNCLTLAQLIAENERLRIVDSESISSKNGRAVWRVCAKCGREFAVFSVESRMDCHLCIVRGVRDDHDREVDAARKT